MNDIVLISIPETTIKNIVEQAVRKALAEHIPPTPTPEDKRFISRKEAAKKLGVCLATLDTLAKEGDLTRYRHGGIVRYLEKDVSEFLTVFQKGKRKLPFDNKK